VNHFWWQQAFHQDYEELYAHRDDASAAAEIAGIIPRLRQVGGPILDMGCGNGRHLAALRAAGLHAFGCDWSEPLLRKAQQRPAISSLIMRGDMRQPPVTTGWGAVILLFTSFGYFPDDENKRCFQALAGLIKSGGWLLLDVPNKQHVEKNLIPFSEKVISPDKRITEQRSLNGNRVEKLVTIFQNNTRIRSYTESVHLYSIAELAVLAHDAHLTLHDTWPSLRGEHADDQRQVVWLKKTAP
jgi:SAM-dependent methyltransferase